MTMATTGPRFNDGGSSGRSLPGEPPGIVGNDLITDKTRHRQLPKGKIRSFPFGYFVRIIFSPKAAQGFTAEIRLGGVGSSLVTVRGGLRPHQSLGSLILCSPAGSKSSSHGSPRSISIRTFLLRTILRIHNCLIISRSSARSWRLSSNSPMPRRSSEKRGRMPGCTAGSAGAKVTS